MHWFGPVFRYDLLRLGRRSRLFFLRWLFVVALLIILFWSYHSFLEKLTLEASNVLAVQGRVYFVGEAAYLQNAYIQRNLHRFGFYFLNSYLILQALLVIVVTPALIAGSIAEEKNRKTLDDLLTTQLTNREIIMGKLLARFTYLILLMLGTVPVIAMMQWVGGIDPLLLLCMLPIHLVGLLAVGSLSLYFSVNATRPRDAIVRTYVCLICFMALWFIPFGMGRWGWLASLRPSWLDVTQLDSWMRIVSICNPLGAFYLIAEAFVYQPTPGMDIASIIMWNVASLSLVSLSLLMIATRRLREQFLRPRAAPRREAAPQRRRGRVWDKALFWKEWATQKRPGVNRLLAVLAIVLATGWIVMHFDYLQEILNGSLLLADVPFPSLRAKEMNDLIHEFRIASAVLFGLFYLRVALRAAGAFPQEKEQDTWVSLLAAPWKLQEIHNAKAMGGAQLFLTYLWFFVPLFLLGLLFQLISVTSFIVNTLCVACHFFFATMLGLFMGLLTGNSMRAYLSTMIIVGVLAAAPLLIMSTFRFFNLGTTPILALLFLVDALEWIWVPALLLVLALIYAKMFSPRMVKVVWFTVGYAGIGMIITVPLFMLIFLTILILETSMNLSEMLSMISPLFQQYAAWTNSEWVHKNLWYFRTHTESTILTMLGIVGGYYLVGGCICRWLGLQLLRKTSGRVDGMKARKKSGLFLAVGGGLEEKKPDHEKGKTHAQQDADANNPKEIAVEPVD